MGHRRHLDIADNFLALGPEDSNPDTAGVIVLAAPFEETSTYGVGSARGPEAIVAASHEVELFDAALGFEAYQTAGGIATLEFLDVAGCDGAGLAALLREETRYWIERGRFVVTLGGEHTSVVGAIEAHCQAYPDVTVLQLDAHSDLRPDYMDSPWNHACAMARVLDFHGRLVQVGIRSQAKEERERANATPGITVFHAHEVLERHDAHEDWIADIVSACTPNVYVTLDCDVLDPSIMAATGTPEPAGLTWRMLDALFARLCAERQLVGFDVNELAPIEGVAYPEFSMAKLIYRIIGRRFP